MDTVTYTVYKIRHKTSHLYSTGGPNPLFVPKHGKFWMTASGARSHINGVLKYQKNADKHPYQHDIEVVQFDMTLKELGVV